jgi:poly(3-hydroxybutyrate) depolymerase
VSNVDVASVDHFVDILSERGVIDRRQIYTLGHGSGGVMAAMYAMVRPDRVAAFATVASDASAWVWACEARPPPAFIAYRACDTVTPCGSVERWLRWREGRGATTTSLRLDASGRRAASCATGRRRCRDAVGRGNHQRWPKSSEKTLLEFFSRYRLQVEP